MRQVTASALSAVPSTGGSWTGSGELNVVAIASVPKRPRGHGRRRTPARITYGTADGGAAGPGDVTLHITPGKTAGRLSREGASLPVQITVTFAPTGGNTNHETIHLTVVGKKKTLHH